MGFEWSDLNPLKELMKPGGILGSDASVEANNALRPRRMAEGDAASRFGAEGARGFNQMGAESRAARQRLADIASGQNSVSAEQLRQGMQQNVSGQMAMAGAARPGNAAMAARTASMNAGAIGSGLAGQQAVAGIQERNAATAALNQAIAQQRALELQAGLGGQQNAINAFSPEGGGTSGSDKALGMAQALGMAALMSDRRIKTDVKDGRKDADDFISSLRPYGFRYKDQKHGKGDRVGIMAQDLEKTKAGRMAVIETRDGKGVDVAQLSGALAAATARLGERLDAIEKDKK